MKKYLIILKTEISSNLSYILNILISFVGYGVILFVFFNLWKYMYADPNSLINGYTMKQMMWYVIVTELLWGCVKGRIVCKKIIKDIKSGNIAYNLTKPYNYILYVLADNMGDALTKFPVYIILCLSLGFIFLRSFPKITLFGIIILLISMLLAIIISMFTCIFIGLLAFYIEDSNPIYWLYSKIMLILGTMFPIEYFPTFLQKILPYSPIFVTCYGPAKIFVDFSYNLSLKVLVAQIIYIVISYLLCLFVYKKGVKKLNVNGG